MSIDEQEPRFIERMIELRQKRGWSQNEMARQVSSAGLSWKQPTVARVEEGSRPLRFTEALIIAKIFNQTIDKMAKPEKITRLQVITRLAAESILMQHLADYHHETQQLEGSFLTNLNENLREHLPESAQKILNWIDENPPVYPAGAIYESDIDLYEMASTEALEIPRGSIHSIPHRKQN
ncbi:helix-turn-helix transcriptional regulator [Corynebacterium pseudodiphtheriticum]|uniref:helix-turn-helix transcriptional regulator n=1 Tax=Corynebacterium pseudodiphtheriticum TaxID=37637 RepID=UPI0025432CF7|nr:helix-turn-helix transcriptional regulator [Corynebacterium pseudodiphtheriticum]MDK4328411.1 helix-turn-helix transcriptional regulator [Corynebacterium pseudodiphtheriticum]